jgi:ribonuclease HII
MGTSTSRAARERERTAALLSFDLEILGQVHGGAAVRLAGLDEAGRGALAGPVVVGCVRLDLSWPELLVDALAGLDDSKRLSPAARGRLFDRIGAVAPTGVGAASAQEIDRLGIVEATSLAARRALDALDAPTDLLLLLDRGLSPGLGPSGPRERAFTHGDALSLSIAAASVVAKVSRDRFMTRLDRRHPGYALALHKGYGTPRHLASLARLGPSPLHRLSFRGAGGR